MSSKRHIRRKMCTRKRRYIQMGDAQGAVDRLNTTYKTRMLIYKCKFCGGWHVGHPPRVVRDQLIAKGIKV